MEDSPTPRDIITVDTVDGTTVRRQSTDYKLLSLQGDGLQVEVQPSGGLVINSSYETEVRSTVEAFAPGVWTHARLDFTYE